MGGKGKGKGGRGCDDGYRPKDVPPTVVEKESPGGHKATHETHPSYGMIRVGRKHGGGGKLFGSPILCDATITLEISRGRVVRDLARDWYHADDELIEVDMSPAQFAELITNLNVGSGFPCTLRRVAGETQPDCPQKHERERIEKEFKDTMRDLAAKHREKVAAVRAMVDDKNKKALTNADRDAIRAALDLCTRFVTDHGPFIQSQFNESMDNTVNAAKAEFTAAAMTIAHAMGVEQLAARLADHDFGPPALEAGPPDAGEKSG